MNSRRTKGLWRAIEKNSHREMFLFLKALQQKRFLIARCDSCNTLHFPPQPFCPDCLNEQISLVEHPGKGTVYAFTSMADPFSGDTPFTVGMVELEGVKGRIFARLEALYEEISIGMEVELDYFELNDVILPCFRPVVQGPR